MTRVVLTLVAVTWIDARLGSHWRSMLDAANRPIVSDAEYRRRVEAWKASKPKGHRGGPAKGDPLFRQYMRDHEWRGRFTEAWLARLWSGKPGAYGAALRQESGWRVYQREHGRAI